MCVAVPAELIERSGNTGVAKFSGSSFNVDLTVVPHAKTGDHVLVHAGCAVEVMRADEAKEISDLYGEVMEAANEGR